MMKKRQSRRKEGKGGGEKRNRFRRSVTVKSKGVEVPV